MVKSCLHIVALILYFVQIGMAQCGQSAIAYKCGEKLQFSAYYNLGFVWINAGSAFFDISETDFEGHRVYKMTTGGGSLPSYDWIMKVRDTLCTYVDTASLRPYMHIRSSHEGSYIANNCTRFDYNKQKVYAHTSNSERGTHDTIYPLSGCLLDIVSSVYKVRNTDYSKAKPEQKFPFMAIVDGEISELFVRYKGTEIVKIHNSERQFRCLKFTVKLIEGSVFNAGEDMTIWITDDKNHLPIKVEAGILVGSVMAFLTDMQGVRYALTSEVVE